jgi:serine protease Do
MPKPLLRSIEDPGAPREQDAQPAGQPASPPEPPSEVELLDAYSRTVISVVDRVGPAVVSVAVKGRSRRRDDGAGSGLVFTPDGYILTNAHVVDDANEVTVKLTDKREFKAKVVGIDKDTDVAVLKIAAKDLPTVKIGDATRAQVGEWVLAIGSPFGFENSATAGVISARARSLPGEGYIPFLQTDVAVNPGNSGGPLFNLAGEVIGINSQIYSGSGGYMGISFAIPINTAMKVGQELLASGKVTRGRLGVAIQDVDQNLARSFGLPKPEGALVSSIDKDGPSANADLKPGDVILALDGQEISSSSDLPPLVADIQPGKAARLKVWRAGKEHEVEVKVGAAKAEAVASNGQGGPEHGRLGLAVRPLSPEEQRQADVQGGVLVEAVSGPAARAGLQPGDVVLSVNGSQVTSVDQLRSLVKDAKEEVALLVMRGNARIFVPVQLG